MVKAVMFVLGFICGMAFVIVASCLIISSEENRREEKAIPIEWIKKYMDKVDIEDCGMVYLSPSGLLRDMLKDWEKENETN